MKLCTLDAMIEVQKILADEDEGEVEMMGL